MTLSFELLRQENEAVFQGRIKRIEWTSRTTVTQGLVLEQHHCVRAKHLAPACDHFCERLMSEKLWHLKIQQFFTAPTSISASAICEHRVFSSPFSKEEVSGRHPAFNSSSTCHDSCRLHRPLGKNNDIFSPSHPPIFLRRGWTVMSTFSKGGLDAVAQLLGQLPEILQAPGLMPSLLYSALIGNAGSPKAEVKNRYLSV